MSANKNDGTSASLNELFEMLSHEYRRRTLTAIARDNPQGADEITSKSVADEHEEDDDVIALLEQQFYHVHLPKLDATGFIDWERDSGLITRGSRFEEIEPLLRLMSSHRDELPTDWP
jgi:hypothetical protein